MTQKRGHAVLVPTLPLKLFSPDDVAGFGREVGHDLGLVRSRLDILRNELRQGGRWRFVEHGPDGEFGFEGDGMPGHVIVTTATFQDLGGRTQVITTMRFDSKEERDAMLKTGMEGGLNESYNALDRLLTE